MKRLYFYLSVLSLFFLFSCKAKQKDADGNLPDEKTFYEIDLSHDFKGSQCDNLLLSDIVEGVEYVQLETTDDCLIDGGCYVALTDKDIYVLNNSSTNVKLFRFDRSTGKFITPIGQTGQGPQDMLRPTVLYAEDDLVYAASNIANKVYAYHKNGEYVRAVSMGRGTGQRITVIQDKYIIRHSGHDFMRSDNNYVEGNPRLYFAAKILDMDGNTLYAKCDTLPGEETSVTIEWDPRRWYYKGELNFYNEVDNTVYTVNEKGVTPRYKFNLGKNRWEVTGKITKEYLGYIKFHQFKETADYLYIFWNQYQKPYFARFDKKNEKLDVQEQVPYEKGRFWHIFAPGPLNDIDGCGINFSPSDGNYEDKAGSFVFMITPDNIDRAREALEKSENVKFPEKRQQLLKLLDSRQEDDNPILAIYKLKN